MFNFFKRPNLTFPEPTPYITEPDTKNTVPNIHYTLGHTDDNRVSFTMGCNRLTMNSAGIDNLIAQLEVFKNQLKE